MKVSTLCLIIPVSKYCLIWLISVVMDRADAELLCDQRWASCCQSWRNYSLANFIFLFQLLSAMLYAYYFEQTAASVVKVSTLCSIIYGNLLRIFIELFTCKLHLFLPATLRHVVCLSLCTSAGLAREGNHPLLDHYVGIAPSVDHCFTSRNFIQWRYYCSYFRCDIRFHWLFIPFISAPLRVLCYGVNFDCFFFPLYINMGYII